MNMPRVKLNNGLLVANFSSKHSFEQVLQVRDGARCIFAP